MAVKTILNPIELQCLSSDPRPIAADGSTLHIIDTGEVFICHESIWEEDKRLKRILEFYFNPL